jgi:hypothetical protein
MDAGGVDKLVKLINSADGKTREAAALALSALCSSSREICNEVFRSMCNAVLTSSRGDAAVVAALDLLFAGENAEQEAAAYLLKVRSSSNGPAIGKRSNVAVASLQGTVLPFCCALKLTSCWHVWGTGSGGWAGAAVARVLHLPGHGSRSRPCAAADMRDCQQTCCICCNLHTSRPSRHTCQSGYNCAGSPSPCLPKVEDDGWPVLWPDV